MPTGYTHAIKDGQTFRDFTLTCARAFGAAIHQRDEAVSAALRHDTVSPYHHTQIQVAKDRLAELDRMSTQDAEMAASTEFQDRHAAWEERRAHTATLRQRYTDMLAQVDAWQPPTPDHKELKAFMRSQITDSIEFDCPRLGEEDPAPTPKTAAAWLAEERARAARSLTYHTEAYEKECRTVAGRNAWIDALMGSL